MKPFMFRSNSAQISIHLEVINNRSNRISAI